MSKEEVEEVLKVNITEKEYEHLKKLNLHNGEVIHAYIALLKYRKIVIQNFETIITDTILELKYRKDTTL